jgi:hypothetical protein
VHNFQTDGAISNTQAGNDFETEAKSFFASRGIVLKEHVALDIGIEGKAKRHKFDLGSTDPRIVVECKCHTWTETDNVPVAKMTTWTEAMYYFYASPKGYRKVFFVLKDFSEKHRETLAAYYLRTYEHLIPCDVEFWEYDTDKKTAERLR